MIRSGFVAAALASCALCGCPDASSGRWLHVATYDLDKPGRQHFFLDLHSVTEADGYIRGRIEGHWAGSIDRIAIALQEADCTGRRIRVLELHDYVDGVEKESLGADEWVEAHPRAGSGFFWLALCGGADEWREAGFVRVRQATPKQYVAEGDADAAGLLRQAWSRP